jgi:hypothetical protein
MATTPVHYNVENWIEENEKYFLPPVCNKMMHNTQLKVIFQKCFFNKCQFSRPINNNFFNASYFFQNLKKIRKKNSGILFSRHKKSQKKFKKKATIFFFFNFKKNSKNTQLKVTFQKLYGLPHAIIKVFNTILYESEFQNFKFL